MPVPGTPMVRVTDLRLQARTTRPEPSSSLRSSWGCSQRGGRRGWTDKRLTGECAADQPHVALGDAERVSDVTGTVAIDVADYRVTEGRQPALPEPHVELRHEQRVPDVDQSVPADIPTRGWVKGDVCHGVKFDPVRCGARLPVQEVEEAHALDEDRNRRARHLPARGRYEPRIELRACVGDLGCEEARGVDAGRGGDLHDHHVAGGIVDAEVVQP